MKERKTFESAYERLEQILEKMNAEQVSLDEALALYEEADILIGTCQKKLSEAEQKIEILLKNRDGSVRVNEKELPQTEDFVSSNESILHE
ncbi:MAG: Exodeoxyribonuclease 7 small subunit [Chlamydiae bacterium]|nr:Exodeoxyribonuclease 7 small subunit [Chlamydiota bacterium]